MAFTVAVVGATGAVGREMLRTLEQRNFPVKKLVPLASARSRGAVLPWKGGEVVVEELTPSSFAGVDFALFSAGASVSKEYGPIAAAAGAIVIDNSSAWRMDAECPLVVPEVNPDAAFHRPKGIIANPNCSTIPLVRLLQTVEQRWGIRQVVVSTYQAASGQGQHGIEELQEGSELALHDPDAELPAERFTAPLAFNVVPFIDRLLDTGFTMEEQKMLQESRKILGLPHLDVTTTCVRVPVVNSHSEAVWVEAAAPVDRAELIDRLAALPEVTVHDRDTPGRFPTPLTAGNPDHVHVGRVRVAPQNPRGFWLWLVADNLRIGAALNAVQIAETVLDRGLL